MKVLELKNKRFALMDGRAIQQQLQLFKAPLPHIHLTTVFTIGCQRFDKIHHMNHILLF